MEEYIQKKEGYGDLLIWLIRLCDLILINSLIVAVYYCSVYFFDIAPLPYDKKILGFVLINLSYFITAAIISINTSTNIIHVDRVIRNAAVFIFSFCLIFTASSSVLGLVDTIPLSIWVSLFATLIISYIMLHISIRLALRSYRRKGFNHRTVIIVGCNDGSKAIYDQLQNSDFGYKIKGYFADDCVDLSHDVGGKGMPQYLGNLDGVEDYVLRKRIDEIFCTLSNNENNRITNLMVFSEKNMVRLFLVPDFFNYLKRRFILRFIESVPVISMRSEPLQHLPNRFIKRTFDIFFSLFVLTFIFPPILLVVGILIKRSSPGPLFFRQERTGFRGKSFFCYKFRSMKVNTDADKARAVKDDPRVTKIGSFIRKTSIDELPQFFNVLKGDMSVVGPRPHMLKHTEQYAKLIDRFMVRHLVKPGITGWAQVTGFRGETELLEDMEGRVKKDVWYIENWSFFLDLKIVFKTMLNAITGEEKAY